MTWHLTARSTLAVSLLSVCLHANGAHPLITEDTGTQGRGNFQIELMNEHAYDNNGVETHAIYSAAVLSVGLRDDLDFVVGLPHLRYSVKSGDEAEYGKGWTDMSIDLKWRFFERDDVSFAFKPSITLPTGDSDLDMGNGKVAVGGFLIASYEPAPWAFHLHAGYLENRNVVNQRRDIRHLSFASTFDVTEKLKLAGDVGINTNTDYEADSHPAFAILGLIYALQPNLDVDLGYKAAISEAHEDRAYLAGLAYRF